MNNKLKIKAGCTTELKVQTKVMEEGFMVSVPYGDCSKYDQIWDIDGKLLKVQVKHACEVSDADGPFGFKIAGCSSSGFAHKIVDGITKLFIKKHIHQKRLMELQLYIMISVILFQLIRYERTPIVYL